jgi:hypothetical protein
MTYRRQVLEHRLAMWELELATNRHGYAVIAPLSIQVLRMILGVKS